MAFTISGDDPLEDVLDEVQRTYGVKVKVVHSSGGDDAPDTQRTKQDRT